MCVLSQSIKVNQEENKRCPRTPYFVINEEEFSSFT